VTERLLSFTDPNTGQHPVREVLNKEDLYDGPFADLAPDMFVQPNDLWSFAHTDALTETTDWPSGGHRHHGILLGVGEGIAKSDLGEKSIVDVPATALAMCGVSAKGLDGHPIEEISGPADAKAEEVSTVSRRPAAGLSEQDEEHISQHLRDLGYIE
jgi:predicted AlkP superfamily phosphohydrolase/phosphomutase